MSAGEVRIKEPSPGRFELTGPLCFETVTAARETGRQRFEASTATALEIDCRGVGDADSAGLALLVDWLAWARAAGRRMHVSGLSPHMRELAAISEVEDLLTRGV